MTFLFPTVYLVSVKQNCRGAGEAKYPLFLFAGIWGNINICCVSQSLTCVSRSVKVRRGQADMESNGWNHRAADQEYRVRNTNTTLCTNWDFHVSCGPGHARTFPSQPRSITEQLLRKQTESRRSVNDAEVFSILWREAQVQALVCPARPWDAR